SPRMPIAPERLFLRVYNEVMRRPLLAIALFWIATLLIERLDWNAGLYKSLAMLAALSALVALTRGIGNPRPAGAALPELPPAIAVSLLLAGQVAFALWQAWDPHLIDIPGTTLEAGRALLAGQNPYTAPIDPGEPEIFRGFKYSPLMAVAYLPLGIPFGEH